MLIPPNWGREYFNGFRALFPSLPRSIRLGLSLSCWKELEENQN